MCTTRVNMEFPILIFYRCFTPYIENTFNTLCLRVKENGKLSLIMSWQKITSAFSVFFTVEKIR